MDQETASSARRGTHPSDSEVQRQLEAMLLERIDEQNPAWRRAEWTDLTEELGITVDWAKVQPDGIWRIGDSAFALDFRPEPCVIDGSF